MRNKIINLILLLISGFTLRVEDCPAADYARLLMCSATMQKLICEDREDDVIDKEISSWVATANAEDPESIVQSRPTFSEKVQLDTTYSEEESPVSRKSSVSEASSSAKTDLEGGFTFAVGKQYTLGRLTKNLIEIIPTFIADEKQRELLRPKSDIARVFMRVVLPCLIKMKALKHFETLCSPKSRKLDSWFVEYYEIFMKAICGINSTDTPVEVYRKLTLITNEFAMRQIRGITLDNFPGSTLIIGKILYNIIGESIRNLKLPTDSEYEVLELLSKYTIDDIWVHKSLGKWKGNGMLKKDYQVFGDADLHTSYYSTFPYFDGTSFKFKYKNGLGQNLPLPDLLVGSHIPVAFSAYGKTKITPFSNIMQTEGARYLFCIRKPELPMVTASTTTSGPMSST